MSGAKQASAVGAATAGTAAAVTAALAGACCAGPSLAPILISVLGVSGLIATTWLRPYTPLILVAAAAMLAFSFRRAYASTSCSQSGVVPRTVRAARVVAWVATLFWLFSVIDSVYGFLHEA